MSRALCSIRRSSSTEGNLIGEDEVALYRDFAERRALLEAALAAQAPVIALTDGLLDIYQQYSAPQLDFQTRRYVRSTNN